MARDEVEQKSPRHVAIIMDGNGRWAELRGQPRLFGHREGAKRIRNIVECCPDYRVEYVTIFAFSTENWKRTQIEVTGLMTLFKSYIKKEARDLRDKGVRVRFIGDRGRLEKSLVKLMGELEELTAENTKVNLTIAINYGGRDEVARATRLMAEDVQIGKLLPENVDEETFTKYLDTRVLPDPDLVIRTSGEARVSNFLLWQAAYAEYEFIETLWPDFTPEIFKQVLTRYKTRDRRFGGVKT